MYNVVSIKVTVKESMADKYFKTKEEKLGNKKSC